MAYLIYPLETSIRNVRAKEGGYQGDHTIGNCNGTECHPPESIPRILDSYFLPSSSNSPHTYGCSHELCPVQIYASEERNFGLDSGLLWCWNGIIL